MPEYRLSYHNIRGRAEPARILFVLAGVPFTDVRIEYKDWVIMKPTAPNGKLPFLEVDGTPLSQSGTICLYLAREFGLQGKTNWDQAIIEYIYSTVVDIMEFAYKVVAVEIDKDEQERINKQFYGYSYDKLMSELSKSLGDKEYYVENRISLADISVFTVVDWSQTWEPLKEAVKKYPKLIKLKERVAKNPRIAKHIATRADDTI